MDGSWTRPHSAIGAVRGVNLRLSDLDPPVINSVQIDGGFQGTARLSRWTDDATAPAWVDLTATDGGLGIKSLDIAQDVTNARISGTDHACAGHRSSPCPKTWGQRITLGPLPEGLNAIHARATDIIGNHRYSDYWIQRIDRTPPQINISGELIDHANDGQLPANPNINIHATDGSLVSPATQRSGVARVRMLLDGQVTHDYNPGGACDNCDRGLTWSLPLSQLAGGPLPVRVEASDYVGHVTVREFTINVPWLADGRLLRETGTASPVFYIDEGVRYALDSSTANYLGVDLTSATAVPADQIQALPAGDDLTISQLEIGGPEPDPGTATASGSPWKRARKHEKPFQFYSSDGRAVAEGTLLWFAGKFPFGYRHRGDFSYSSFVYPVGSVGCIWLKVKWGYPAANASFPPGGGVSGAETVDGYYVGCRTGSQVAPSPMPMYGLGFAKGLLNSATITICSSDSRAQGPRFCANNKIRWGW